MPNCCGAIDGKYVRIKNQLMAVVDANYRFLFVDIGQPRGDSDGSVWSNSYLAYAVDYCEAEFPPNKKVTRK